MLKPSQRAVTFVYPYNIILVFNTNLCATAVLYSSYSIVDQWNHNIIIYYIIMIFILTSYVDSV